LSLHMWARSALILLEWGFKFRRETSYEWNVRAEHSLYRRSFHLLPSPNTAIFPLANILYKQKS
jgi:hypothetical protein